MSVEIVENYNDYTPTIEFIPTIRRALKIVPDKYLVGLDRIVLTNAGGLSRSRRRRKTRSRKRKVNVKDSLGLYRGDHIELFVDNIVGDFENAGYSFRQFALNELADVLFHEIGHHIHRTKRPEYREPENVADDYMRQFSNAYRWRNLHRTIPAALLLLGMVALSLTDFYWVKRRLLKFRSGNEGQDAD